jgi:RNA polymerase sigma factor (sigma-70 family)
MSAARVHMRRIVKGDRSPKLEPAGTARFEKVILPHLDAAYTLACYLTRDSSDAEDALQEAILRAVQYFHSLRDERDARAWLLTIVRRECYSGRSERRARLDTISYDDEPHLQLVDKAESPETAAERSLIRTRLRIAVDQLPERLREALILRELQQCSYEEIAMITEAPLGTVMSRLSRARARLAETLRDVVDIGDIQ